MTTDLLIQLTDTAIQVVPYASDLFADVPNPGDGQQPPGFERFTDILSWAKWIALGILVVLLMAAGVRLATGGRTGQGEDHAGRVGMVLIGAIVVSGSFTLISFLAA